MARMRRKKNLIPRMERCSALYVATPAANKGIWRQALGLPNSAWLELELGCGKGGFSVKTAAAYPNRFILAMDRVNEALIVGMERAQREQVDNLRFFTGDASKLTDLFAPGEVNKIYLNFSDPWPSKRHAKRRMTFRAFLSGYRQVLADSGEIQFKTDNADLFAFSVEEFQAAEFTLVDVTDDLHKLNVPNITTEYEEKFSAMGIPIHRLIAVKRQDSSGNVLPYTYIPPVVRPEDDQ